MAASPHKISSLALAVLALGVTPPLAQELRAGWGFQFRQDTFDETVFPVSMMTESGDGFEKALLAFTCGKDGALVPFYQGGGFSVFSKPEKVSFKGKDGIVDVTFEVGEVPRMGKRLTTDAKSTDALIALFEAADGADVPFRSGEKKGLFSSIASKITFRLIRETCPK